MSCECEIGIAVEAAKDGVYLKPGRKFAWLNSAGPYGLGVSASSAFDPVKSIAVDLRGDLEAMKALSRPAKLPVDLIHEDSGIVFEVDELQHFTSHRGATFDHYPEDVRVSFDIEEYLRLCTRYSPRADTAFLRDTFNFGPKSRGRQRAFYDALKDLSIPAAGLPPVVRIPVPDRDVEKAWKNSRDRVLAAIETALTRKSSL